MNEFLLLTPGPTTVPPRILEKLSLPLIHHRTKEYQVILERVNANLQKVFLTKHPVMTFACSGTGAMEASITNCLSKTDKVLSFSAGKWGERYRDIARAYGLNVISTEKASGEAFTPQEIKEALEKNPDARAVLITLCETSTAVTHPIEAIAKVTSQSPAVLMVDAISGLGCDPLKMDEWRVDVVVCGSQKGLMLPPGLAFVAVNERAQDLIAKSTLPKYYFNFAQTLKAQKKNDTPFTPAVSLVRGLDVALGLMLKEGMENIWKRHLEISRYAQKAFGALGLKLFSEAPSRGLTAVSVPEGVVSGNLIQTMRDTHRVIMADGQGELQGKIVRMAHMGYCYLDDAKKGIEAMKDALERNVVKK